MASLSADTERRPLKPPRGVACKDANSVQGGAWNDGNLSGSLASALPPLYRVNEERRDSIMSSGSVDSLGSGFPSAGLEPPPGFGFQRSSSDGSNETDFLNTVPPGFGFVRPESGAWGDDLDEMAELDTKMPPPLPPRPSRVDWLVGITTSVNSKLSASDCDLDTVQDPIREAWEAGLSITRAAPLVLAAAVNSPSSPALLEERSMLFGAAVTRLAVVGAATAAVADEPEISKNTTQLCKAAIALLDHARFTVETDSLANNLLITRGNEVRRPLAQLMARLRSQIQWEI